MLQCMFNGTSGSPSGKRWCNYLRTGLIVYSLTSLVAVLGVVFARDYVRPRSAAGTDDVIGSFAMWDGQWFKEIAEEGYNFDPTRQSNIAFFPAFPLAGRELARVGGLRTELALLLLTHLALAATFVFVAAYIDLRFGPGLPAMCGLMLLAFGLWPTTFFFRMAYSESFFLLTAVLTLYGVERS